MLPIRTLRLETGFDSDALLSLGQVVAFVDNRGGSIVEKSRQYPRD